MLTELHSLKDTKALVHCFMSFVPLCEKKTLNVYFLSAGAVTHNYSRVVDSPPRAEPSAPHTP